MSEDMKQNVDTSSAKFKEGVEAGLNSTKDTKNWQAGNELGQELKDETERKAPLDHESTVPVFMRNSPERKRGNAQDEKDETKE